MCGVVVGGLLQGSGSQLSQAVTSRRLSGTKTAKTTGFALFQLLRVANCSLCCVMSGCLLAALMLCCSFTPGPRVTLAPTSVTGPGVCGIGRKLMLKHNTAPRALDTQDKLTVIELAQLQRPKLMQMKSSWPAGARQCTCRTSVSSASTQLTGD